ncbi:MAG: hypothetical protein SGARI_005246, partial [Bacillariaceae sp.]
MTELNPSTARIASRWRRVKYPIVMSLLILLALYIPSLLTRNVVDRVPQFDGKNTKKYDAEEAPKIAVLISGQFGRFIYKDNKGPLVAGPHDFTNSTLSSLQRGCKRSIVDVYIALHRGTMATPGRGIVSSPPYLSDNTTIAEIKRYYKEERGANNVFIKFVDDEHMSNVEADIFHTIEGRGLPEEYMDEIEEYWDKQIGKYSRMFYMRHLAYAMTIEQQQQYDAYVSQREDAFFFEPLNFEEMNFDFSMSTLLNGEPATSELYTDLRDAKPYLFVEPYCEWGSYSDKIHIGNDFAMFTLWGKTWQDFIHIMLRWADFGYVRQDGPDGLTKKQRHQWNNKDPYQTEAFLQDLLNGGHVEKVDTKR